MSPDPVADESAGSASASGESPASGPRRRRVASSTLKRASALGSGRPATIYDVARAAGVSHQTVTRYLNGFEGIRPETRARVKDALRALDYRPNLNARSLNSGRSRRIGALIQEIDQYGPSKVLQGATAAAREAGYVLDVVAQDVSRRTSIMAALDLLSEHDLAGILALSSTDEMTRAFESSRFGVPVVICTEPDDVTSGHPSELTTRGFPGLVRHLADLGHRRFLHIAGPTAWSSARNRARAYEAAVARHGLRSVATLPGDWTARSGFDAVMGVPGELGATAVVAANDQMALGAMLALTRRGLSVPGDVSVTGVDDIPDAAFFSPPLTTLRADFAAQGRAAVAALLAQIDGGESEVDRTWHSELVVRESTGEAP
ncbi:LacI family DNA-binding transcriptional regulator [Nonomuraea candida]|uniref:LacI family DNA-binding transcriptional regulator n=1 Tax=Nonomuraea candida TaxID=359159 RepID=UPI0009FD105B|nr:LacI family DNA-binding transcriptional regulator [Nonomuraea candida]